MSKQVYNLMWIRPDFVKKGEDSRQPLTDELAQNVLGIAKQNQGVDVRLWIDSERLSEKQAEWLKELTKKERNLHLKDLRDIRAYSENPLFNIRDEVTRESFLRDTEKQNPIWKIIDMAKILTCMYGINEGYKEAYYSDLDITNLRINSDEVRSIMNRMGLIISGVIGEGRVGFENQLFGFRNDKKKILEDLYGKTSRVEIGENGYGAFMDVVNREIKRDVGDLRIIVFETDYSLLEAEIPKWKGGSLEGNRGSSEIK